MTKDKGGGIIKEVNVIQIIKSIQEHVKEKQKSLYFIFMTLFLCTFIPHQHKWFFFQAGFCYMVFLKVFFKDEILTLYDN